MTRHSKIEASQSRFRAPTPLATLCLPTQCGGSSDWQSQRSDALFLITGGKTRVGLCGEKKIVAENSALLVREGENRGYWNINGNAPRIWGIFFRLSASSLLPSLAEPDPAK